MALLVDTNNLVLQANTDRLGQLLIVLKNRLIANGWTVRGSSDGQTTFQNEGQTAGPYDVFTAAQPWVNDGATGWRSGGPNTISRRSAWMRLREPLPSTREFIFQRYAADSDLGMNYLSNLRIAVNGFLNNNAAITTIPTTSGLAVNAITTDTQFMAAATLGTLTANVFKSHIWISNQAEAGNVWPFAFMNYDSVTGLAGGLIYSSLLHTSPGHTHPFVFRAGAAAAVQATPNSNLTSWTALRGNSLAVDTALASTNYTLIPSATAQIVSALDGRRRTSSPMFYDSEGRWLGFMQHCAFNPTTRTYPDTIDVATANSWLQWGTLLMPWKQGVTPQT